MNNHEGLVRKKESLMRRLSECLANWEDHGNDAFEVLEENNRIIQSMQEIDQQLTTEQLNEYNEIHAETWQAIITIQRKLVESVLTQKEKVQEQLVQIGQKDKIISNYISLQKNSVFVEKDY